MQIVGPHCRRPPWKPDRVALTPEGRPQKAWIVLERATSDRPQRAPAGINALRAPISIYEVHLGSWRRHPQHSGRWLNYPELAGELPAYPHALGFTPV